MATYANIQTLEEHDNQVASLGLSPASLASKIAMAERDVLADLLGHGYEVERYPPVDDSAFATCEVTLTAGPDSPLDIEEGTLAATERELDGDRLPFSGAPLFALPAVTIAAGASQAVTATATLKGARANIPASTLDTLAGPLPENFAGITHAQAAGGRDHQLARATSYRALELIHTDAMRIADDAHAHKRKVYRELYKEELSRLVARGVTLDTDGDGEPGPNAEPLAHGFHRLTRS